MNDSYTVTKDNNENRSMPGNKGFGNKFPFSSSIIQLLISLFYL